MSDEPVERRNESPDDDEILDEFMSDIDGMKNIHSVQVGEISAINIFNNPRLFDALREEIKSLSDQARELADAEAKRSRVWTKVHIVLGLPTAIIAAVAGATGLISTTGRIPAGILALCAAAMSAASSFLNGELKASDAGQRAAALSTISIDARVLATHGLEERNAPHLRQSLTSLIDRFEAVRTNDLSSAEVLKAAERAG